MWATTLNLAVASQLATMLVIIMKYILPETSQQEPAGNVGIKDPEKTLLLYDQYISNPHKWPEHCNRI
jgi:hypothetical protein